MLNKKEIPENNSSIIESVVGEYSRHIGLVASYVEQDDVDMAEKHAGTAEILFSEILSANCKLEEDKTAKFDFLIDCLASNEVESQNDRLVMMLKNMFINR